MKLNLPSTTTITHKTELPLEYASLSGGEKPWVSAEIKAGGHVNPSLMSAMEQVEEFIAVRDAERKTLDPSERAIRERKDNLEAGRRSIVAHYENCVASWSTNIIDMNTGKPIEPTLDNFMGLFDMSLPNVVAWVASIPAKARKVSDFIVKRDEETEKN